MFKFYNLFVAFYAFVAVSASGASKETCKVTNEGTHGKWTSQSGDFNGCQIVNGTYVMETLPGNGWDNLRNVAMGPVLSLDYSQCRTTHDRKFLVPDNVHVDAIKESNVHIYSQLISHMSNYTSSTSVSINVEAEGTVKNVHIGGSFSTDYQEAKSKIINEKSIISRSELRYCFYSVRSYPDSQLHPSFKDRVLDIASCVQANDSDTARYLSDLLVRDYGTHYVTVVDAGALIVQEDHVTSKYVETMKRKNISVSAAAGANFNKEFGVKVSMTTSVSNEHIKEYLNNRTDTRVRSMGGPPFKANFSTVDWSSDLENNLVVVDRNGDPLHYAITSKSLPELPMATTLETLSMVKEAVRSYFENNIYRGCTKIDSPNFSFIANIDDGSCKDAATNHSFGGIYQSCTGGMCDSHNTQMNPKTKDFTCPEQYTPVLMYHYKAMECVRKCKKKGLTNKKHCHKDCHHSDTSQHSAIYEAYWCAAEGKVKQDSGYLFGGVYTATAINPLTGTRSCPQHFVAMAFGVTLKMYVCISDDYELGVAHSIPFAGFFSCLSGNPLVLNKNTKGLKSPGAAMSLTSFLYDSGPTAWPKGCPSGYSQHLLAITDSCEINYCVKANALSQRTLPAIRRPPFVEQPETVNYATRMFIGYDDKIWIKIIKDGSAQWQTTDITANDETMACLSDAVEISTLASCGNSPRDHEHGSDNNTSTSALTIAFVSTGSVLLAMVVFAIPCYVGRHCRRQREYRAREGPRGSVNDQVDGERAALLNQYMG